MSAAIRVGVCGFCLPQAQLFSRFHLLEVQQTFYWPPRLKTVERWRRTAPSDFEFTIKAFQAITHPCTSPTYRRARLTAQQMEQCGNFGDTPMVREAWTITEQIATALEATHIVFQSPPRFDASAENVARLRRFFEGTPRGKSRIVWEPRHTTWTDDIIRDLCSDLDLIHAVDPLERASVYGTPAYFRLHGHALGDYKYNYNRPYSDADLQLIYERCRAGASYCLFNNMQMAQDAERFARLLTVEGRNG